MNLLRLFFAIVAAAIITSCGSDTEDSDATIFTMTVDGKSEKLTVTEAYYSPIQRRFVATVSGTGGYYAIHLKETELESMGNGSYSTQCGLIIEGITTGFIGSTIFSESAGDITISSILRSESAYRITAEGTNLEMANSNGDNKKMVEKISFTLNFAIPDMSTFDYVSCEIDGVPYTFYSKEVNAYQNDYSFQPDPSDVYLLVTGNVGNDNSIYYSMFEGLTLKVQDATYPPVVSSSELSFEDGLIVSFTRLENDLCFSSNQVTYRNSYNQAANYNTCKFAITNVVESTEGYTLEGKFHGKITEDTSENPKVLTIENGTFKTFVKKI